MPHLVNITTPSSLCYILHTYAYSQETLDLLHRTILTSNVQSSRGSSAELKLSGRHIPALQCSELGKPRAKFTNDFMTYHTTFFVGDSPFSTPPPTNKMASTVRELTSPLLRVGKNRAEKVYGKCHSKSDYRYSLWVQFDRLKRRFHIRCAARCRA